LRIDVNNVEADKNYKVPRDNPFVKLARRLAGNLGLRAAQSVEDEF